MISSFCLPDHWAYHIDFPNIQPACLGFWLPLLLYFRSYCGSALRTILRRLIKPRIWLALHLTDRSCMHSYLSIVLVATISFHARLAHLLHILFNTTPPSRLHAHIFCCCLIHMYSLALWSVRVRCLTSALIACILQHIDKILIYTSHIQYIPLPYPLLLAVVLAGTPGTPVVSAYPLSPLQVHPASPAFRVCTTAFASACYRQLV